MRVALLVFLFAVVGLVVVDGVEERSASLADADADSMVVRAVIDDRGSGGDQPGAPAEAGALPDDLGSTTSTMVALATVPIAPPSTVPVVELHPLTVPTGDSPQPVRIRVSSLVVDAAVIAVGVDDVGDFDVPSAEQVGWYRFGPTPGDQGSAVLAAHVDYNRRPGVFSRLHEAVEGDRIEIEFDDGSIERFAVTTQLLYDKSVLPAAELFRSDGRPVLRLITCGGTFDEAAGHYRGNRVVTAVPVD